MNTLASKIRTLANRGQYGHSRQPRNFYMAEGGCSFYWNNGGVIKTQAEWDKACRLLARYRRFVEFVEGWTVVPGSTAHYADNSTECREVSRQGKVRRRTLVAAGGDACF